MNVWVNDSGGGSFRQTVEVKVPRTSGGLLWQILALPVTDLIAITIGIVAAVLVCGRLGVPSCPASPVTRGGPPRPRHPNLPVQRLSGPLTHDLVRLERVRHA